MAGAGFIRRYSYFPGTEELNAIEGVVIVDQRSLGPIRGASYGVVCVVGEAANMSYVCKVNTSGEVVSSFRPQQVFGGSDLLVARVAILPPRWRCCRTCFASAMSRGLNARLEAVDK